MSEEVHGPGRAGPIGYAPHVQNNDKGDRHAQTCSVPDRRHLAGCGATMNPQTRDEYRQAIASGVPLTMTDTYVVQRRFDEVVKSLKQKADECLQVDVTTKRSQGGMTTMNVRDEYRTSVRVVDKSRAELTTQSTMKGAIVVQ